MSTARICAEAESFGQFDTVRSWNETDITELIESNFYHFKLYKNMGFGLWLWKPYVVLKRLKQLSENEILLYLDAGVHLNIKGLDRFRQYIGFITDSGYEAIVFSTNDFYKAKSYVKADCVNIYYPEFYELDPNCNYAGILILKNTHFVRDFIAEWLRLCSCTDLISPNPSVVYPDPKFYKGQDADNGVFNLVVESFINHKNGKNKILKIFPDEVNLYDRRGQQIAHALTLNEYSKYDWSALDFYPFQCRRDRPANIAKNNNYQQFPQIISHIRRILSMLF